jgi:hypothetical protein
VGWGLADKLTLFYAPKLLGAEGVPLMGSLNVTSMAGAPKFRVDAVEKMGEDIAVTLYPLESEESLFTGLVEGTGRVISVGEGGMARLVIDVGRLAEDTRLGDSVSVNGVCLTVNEADAETLIFYAMPETLRRTALGSLREGGVVNLERAMTPEKRFGGHIVQGHVDGVGEVVSMTPKVTKVARVGRRSGSSRRPRASSNTP